VFLEVGLTLHFWLNILLTLLGYIPVYGLLPDCKLSNGRDRIAPVYPAC
jgi:hypothetical protein